MMNPKELLKELRDYCRKNENPDIVKKYSRYFKDGVYDAYGLSQKLLDEKVIELINRKDISLDLILKTAPLLMESGKYEETTFVLSYLNRNPKLYDTHVFEAISSWFPIGIRNWAHADILGMQILPNIVKSGIITINDFSNWIKSEYKYQRRCVPVTLIKSLKTAENFTSLFKFIEPLMIDSEREVHQGVGWFLREAWKIKPQETETFLLKWKGKAPRLIFQYACEKMKAEEKLRFRKEKK
jgi:3-methyladenine DNA glycosylase AlkD